MMLSWTALATADNYPRDFRIDVVHYVFRFALNDTTDQINAKAEIDIRFKEAGVISFCLDLVGKASQKDSTGMTVATVEENHSLAGFAHRDSRVIIRMTSPSRAGEIRRYTVSYRGRPADGLIIARNKYNERTFFGDNWPDRARHWLPVVDHPSDKATCEFIVTAPEQYQVIASGRLAEESNLTEGRKLTRWKSVAPLATKVMVMGVARFAVAHLEPYRSIPLESWVYPRDRDAGFTDFAQVRKIIAFFDAHVGPFAYAKLASVQSTTRYGGMENAGNVFYHERSVRGDRSNERLMAHEIAHQWFGDAISEADWHHIWLSEGFATYFTHLYTAFHHGRDRMVAGLKRDRDRIFAYEKKHPQSPVVDTTITNLMRLLSTNSYQKGSWVLHMLRRELGDDVFWDGIREYYRTFCNTSVLTSDFCAVMERVSCRELTWFFRQWIQTPGHPTLKGSWHWDRKTQEVVIRLDQVQKDGTIFRFPLDIALKSEDGISIRTQTEKVDQLHQIFRIPSEQKPADIMLDPDTWLLMEGACEQQ